MMRRVKSIYYELIISVFEKYGFHVIESSDRKTLYISKHPSPTHSVPFTEIEEVFLKEGLDEFIDGISPVHIATWKITVI
jgi:hypothetical protein